MNGVPLNDGEDLSAYTSNYTDILNSLKSVKITRGSGISSNGSSSFAGSIDMETLSPFDTVNEISLMTGSFNSNKTSAILSTGNVKNFGGIIKVTRTASDGFRYNSSGKSKSAFISLGSRSNLGVIKFYSVQGYTENEQSWLPTTEGLNPRTNLLIDTKRPAQWDHFYQGINQLQFIRAFSDKITVTISPYLTKIIGNYDLPRFSSMGEMINSDKLSNLALNSMNIGTYGNIKYETEKLKILSGFTVNEFNRKHIGEYLVIIDDGNGKTHDDYTNYQNTGFKHDKSAFIKASYTKNSFTFNIDGEVKNSKFNYKSETFNKEFYNYTFFNGSAGISAKMDDLNFYFSIARSNREPSRTDIFGQSDHLYSKGTGLLMNNSDSFNYMKPETVDDIETGIKLNLDNFRFEGTLYMMNFKNEIVATNMYNSTGIQIRKNLEKSTRTGIEGAVKYKNNLSENYSLMSNCTFNFSQNIFVNNNDKISNIPFSPGIYNNLETFIHDKKRNLIFGVSYKFCGWSYMDEKNDHILPEQHIINSQISYIATKKITVSIFVNNLLNKNWTQSGNVSYDNQRQFFYTSGINYYTTINFKL